MALPNQLKSARMTGSTLGKDIPVNIGALEQAICDIFGFTINVNVTESPVGSDNAGIMTKALLRQKAAAPVGWRFLDSTGGGECRMVNDGTYVSIDQNTGTEGTPIWTNQWKMAIATGIVTFSAIPVGPAVDPTADNQFARKAYVSGLDAGNEKTVNKGGVSGYCALDASQFPVTPSGPPTTDYQAANKKYVDDNRGLIKQIVNTQSGAAATGTTIMPYDGTKPQITEGDEYMTRVITPTSAVNKLKIEVVVILTNTAAQNGLTAALFADAGTDALACIAQTVPGIGYMVILPFIHYMTAGTTNPITFRVRCGGNLSGTTTLNGVNGVAAFGGAIASSITITEIND